MSAAKKIPTLSVVPNSSVAAEAHLYELLFAEAGDAILLVDCDAKKIASANRRLQELTGYVAAELEGNGIAMLFPESQTEQARKLRSALFNPEMLAHSGFYEDMALVRKDGYLAFATLSVKTLPAEQTDGRNLAFCILHDMGAKKSMERDLLAKHWELKTAYEELNRAHMELKSAQEALVQAGKLAALGELAAGVAHELNQPLMGVMGFGQELESLLKKSFPDATALDYAGEVTKNAVRMKKIIQQLREFTRRSTEDFRNTEVAEVVGESLKLLEQQFKSRGIEVSVNAEPGLPAIYCNPFQLEQVFINLATNARDAIEASGRGSGSIAIELRRKNADAQRFVEISFRDDGTGMSLETQNRALEPFYTTKEVGKGTGLGLSVSYGILSKIHGTMLIESAPGKGTAFLLTLPVDYRSLNSQEKKEGT